MSWVHELFASSITHSDSSRVRCDTLAKGALHNLKHAWFLQLFSTVSREISWQHRGRVAAHLGGTGESHLRSAAQERRIRGPVAARIRNVNRSALRHHGRSRS